MLVETPSNSSFQIGDTVKIRTTGQVGTIVGMRNGQYQVSVNGMPMMAESSALERKEILLG